VKPGGMTAKAASIAVGHGRKSCEDSALEIASEKPNDIKASELLHIS
jgi:hypothetical protein